jgi:hypothetical protein
VTPHRRPAVFSADLARTIRALEAPPQLWPQIAHALGLSIPEGAVLPEPAVDVDAVLPERRGGAGSDAGAAAPSVRTASPAAEGTPTVRAALPSELRALTSPPAPPPLWRTRTDVIPAPGQDSGRRSPPEPLFVAGWRRGILATMLATAAHTGEVDVLPLVDDLARGREISEVPRRVRSTLARGVQLCVDVSGSMQPFGHDRAEMVRALRSIIGGSPIQTLYFAGCPARGAGPGPRDTWRDYAPPERSRPVLLVTDLGIARPRHDSEPASPEEWLRFVRELAHARCPVVALVPYRAERVDARVRARVHVVQWDRSTSVRTIRGAIGRALDVA